MTRRVTTPFPTGEFCLNNGDLPEVRQWLHANGARWNSGSSLITYLTSSPSLRVRPTVTGPIVLQTIITRVDNTLELTFSETPPLTVKKVLTLFLKKHRVYTKFVANLDCGDLDYHIDEAVAAHALIDGAFTWLETEQGHPYWSDLNNKWVDMCNSLELNSLERL